MNSVGSCTSSGGGGGDARASPWSPISGGEGGGCNVGLLSTAEGRPPFLPPPHTSSCSITPSSGGLPTGSRSRLHLPARLSGGGGAILQRPHGGGERTLWWG